MLRLHQNRNTKLSTSKIFESKNFLAYINLKFTQNVVPGKEICADEALVTRLKEDSVAELIAPINQLNREYVCMFW